MNGSGPALRIDKWLWHARFFKTRTMAAKIVAAGKVRVNGKRVDKAATSVRPGDGLTFPQGMRIRVVRVVALGTRRGPAPEAATLFEDLEPPAARDASTEAADTATRTGARPTKKNRRAMERMKSSTD